MDELLDRCYDRVDAAAFIQHLESGLKVRAGGVWRGVPLWAAWQVMPLCTNTWAMPLPPASLPAPLPPKFTHQPSTPHKTGSPPAGPL
jgi:hypothetical protein